VKPSQTLELLPTASLFLHIATPEDIEQEMLSLEHEHGLTLRVHSNETVTRSGARCTRIEWEVVNG